MVQLEQQSYECLPAGEYTGAVHSIEGPEEGKFGPCLKWILVLDHEGQERLMFGYTGAKFSTQAKLFRWTAAALGVSPRDVPSTYNFDSEKLVGKPIRIILSIKEGETDDFNRVDDVLPVAKQQPRQRAQAAQPPAPAQQPGRPAQPEPVGYVQPPMPEEPPAPADEPLFS